MWSLIELNYQAEYVERIIAQFETQEEAEKAKNLLIRKRIESEWNIKVEKAKTRTYDDFYAEMKDIFKFRASPLDK